MTLVLKWDPQRPTNTPMTWKLNTAKGKILTRFEGVDNRVFWASDCTWMMYYPEFQVLRFSNISATPHGFLLHINQFTCICSYGLNEKWRVCHPLMNRKMLQWWQKDTLIIWLFCSCMASSALFLFMKVCSCDAAFFLHKFWWWIVAADPFPKSFIWPWLTARL